MMALAAAAAAITGSARDGVAQAGDVGRSG
jgi:hypothetical protein